jgi:uncharacterized protein YbjQ (UPF0145 family)
VFLSTLPDVPGWGIEIRGLVYAQATLGSMGGGNTRKLVQSLTEQATGFGADGVVDVRTVLGGDTGHCVMTGTAVKLVQR